MIKKDDIRIKLCLAFIVQWCVVVFFFNIQRIFAQGNLNAKISNQLNWRENDYELKQCVNVGQNLQSWEEVQDQQPFPF